VLDFVILKAEIYSSFLDRATLSRVKIDTVKPYQVEICPIYRRESWIRWSEL